jgi:hypothetical protein
LQSGTFQSLISVPGYLHDLNLKTNGVENANSVSEQDANQSKSDSLQPDKKEGSELAENRGRRDSGNLLYYINTMGKPYFGIFLIFVAIEVVFVALQRK